MDPELYEATQVDNITIIHPLAMIALVVIALLMFVLPRRKVIVPLFIMTFLIPMNQRIAVGGLDFYLFRILIIVGWIRLMLRSDFYLEKFTAIDKTIILWTVTMVVTYTLLWQTKGAFVNRLGLAFNAIGIYFLLRSLIRDFEDINRIITSLVYISTIIAFCMVVEQTSKRNLFAIFGGVPEFTYVRDGLLRSQGAFMHPIMAGTFGASLLPLFVSLWWRGGRNKALAVLGVISASIITATSSSSGPFLAYLAAVAAIVTYRFRKHIREIRWGIFLTVIGLHLVMKAPVWALLDRAAVFGSSTAYRRYVLVDQFIKRFDEWWLLGTKSTAHWGHESLQLWDVTNNFIRVAVDGGLISLILFILLIVFCFRYFGKALKAFRKQDKTERLLWAMGAMLFTHIVAFIGVSYFDQMIFLWYLPLAMAATVSTILYNLTHSPDFRFWQ